MPVDQHAALEDRVGQPADQLYLERLSILIGILDRIPQRFAQTPRQDALIGDTVHDVRVAGRRREQPGPGLLRALPLWRGGKRERSSPVEEFRGDAQQARMPHTVQIEAAGIITRMRRYLRDDRMRQV